MFFSTNVIKSKLLNELFLLRDLLFLFNAVRIKKQIFDNFKNIFQNHVRHEHTRTLLDYL